jgi:hypothetical protein
MAQVSALIHRRIVHIGAAYPQVLTHYAGVCLGSLNPARPRLTFVTSRAARRVRDLSGVTTCASTWRRPHPGEVAA